MRRVALVRDDQRVVRIARAERGEVDEVGAPCGIVPDAVEADGRGVLPAVFPFPVATAFGAGAGEAVGRAVLGVLAPGPPAGLDLVGDRRSVEVVVVVVGDPVGRAAEHGEVVRLRGAGDTEGLLGQAVPSDQPIEVGRVVRPDDAVVVLCSPAR